jgi:hypothetical protein
MLFIPIKRGWNQLKELLSYSSSAFKRYDVYEKLYAEYKSYQSDSAMVYARKSFQIAEKLNDIHKINHPRLKFGFDHGNIRNVQGSDRYS